MTAVTKPLFIEQGATFTLGFAWHREGPEVDGEITPGDPYDLTGCSARMQVRKKTGDPVLLTATTALTGPGAQRILLGGLTGRIDVTLDDEDTDLLTTKSAVYDLEIEWPPASRAATVSITDTSAAITAGTATFTSLDVGAGITGAGIPAATTILTVISATSATLSAAATATNASLAATITSSARPRVDRLLQGPVTVDPNVTQVDGDDPVILD